ncbi:hypothetical protein QOT17_005271 [Balamuthia mandrillaris]
MDNHVVTLQVLLSVFLSCCPSFCSLSLSISSFWFALLFFIVFVSCSSSRDVVFLFYCLSLLSSFFAHLFCCASFFSSVWLCVLVRSGIQVRFFFLYLTERAREGE